MLTGTYGSTFDDGVASNRLHTALGGVISAPIGAPSVDETLLMAVLDELDYGLMVLEPSTGRLVHANRLAVDEYRLHNTLVIVQGRVRARHRDSDAVFEPAIAGAAQGRRALISLIGENVEPLPVAVVPLRGGNGQALALLTFGKRQFCEALSVSFFAKLHALTPAEEGVLKALCRGLRPAQIAVESKVAISTVRTQVSSIRLKTGTPSIRELVKKVSTLPPMPSALRGVGPSH